MTKTFSRSLLAAIVLIFAFTGTAFAASTIDSVTLDGGASVTVGKNVQVSAEVTNTSTPDDSSNRWRATGWLISTTPPGSTTCADHGNHQNETTTESFNITTPSTPGTYSAYFVAYSENDCTQNESNLFTLENAVTVLDDVTVTIVKYVDGVHATSINAESSAFPMSSCWSATNIGSGCGSYTLSTSGFNNPNPYEATTADMTAGADYATSEATDTSVVGASCSEGKPFALLGYTTGETEAEAAAATVSLTAPSFTGIESDKYIIVWNQDCSPKLTLDKVVINDNGGTQSELAWLLTASQGAGSGTTVVGPTEIGGPGAAGATDVVSDATLTPGTFNLSESGPSGYTASAWSCVKNAGAAVSGSSINLAYGDTAVCTITNNDNQSYLIVKKVLTNDNGGSRTVSSFKFRVNGGALTPFEVDAQNDFAVIPGSYSIVEDATVGYITTYGNSKNASASCSGLSIGTGETVTCTITNDDVPPPPSNACSLASVPGYTVQNGTPGTDVVTLTSFTMFKGNGGNDVVTSSANGNFIVCTGSGNDTVRLTGSGFATIDAGSGKNTITVGNMEGTILSGSGDDLVSAGNGARTMNLGDGNNTVTTGSGNQTVTTGTGDDMITTGSGNDVVNAGAGKNKVFSNGGTDTLTALGGNDFFDAGTGTDSCSPGGGVNTVINCP